MTTQHIDRRLSIAPMMNHTDKHFRYFMRLLTRHAVLYTEMITTGALLHGDRQRYLDYNDIEHPLAIQLGGSDPTDLAQCARIAENEGYDEVNLNIGCPSDRVQNGQFGACLMSNTELLGHCVNTIQAAVKIPVTIKTRIGIDDEDSYEFLKMFVKTISEAGCDTFIIHARKAILNGLSPKQNRVVPPLNYERVYKIKRAFPALNITINGGFTELDKIKSQFNHVDGVMIGRVAYKNPFMLVDINKHIFEDATALATREDILLKFKDYVLEQCNNGVNIKSLTRPIIGLYQGRVGARQYRRLLTEAMPDDIKAGQYFDNIIQSVSPATNYG